MTEAEIIRKYAPEAVEDMRNGGVLASISLALILSGKMDHVDSGSLISAHGGRRNRGELLYPGIAKAKTFDEAASIIRDDGTLTMLNTRWGLSRRFDNRKETETILGRYKISSTRVHLYAGPGREYAAYDHCSKRGTVEITKEKNGFGKIKGTAAWLELAKARKYESD